MTNRALTSVALLAVAVSTFAVACAGGGGNSAVPCCGATGQVEQQPAFAPFAPGDLRAEPVVFENSSGCISASATGLSLDPVVSAGRSVRVVDGRYDVTILDEFRTRPVFIRVYAEDDAEKIPLGVGIVPTESAETDLVYRLAPIGVDAAAPYSFGESTVEAVLFCGLRGLVLGSGNALQNMRLTDVRAGVTAEIAAAFDPAVPLEATRAGGTGTYRHAVNGIVQFARDAGLGEELGGRFIKLRTRAESFVDSCRDGVKPDTQSRIACDSADPNLDKRAEFYRGWALTRLAADEQVSFGAFEIDDHLMSFAQDYAEAVGNLTSGTNLIAVEHHRRSQMLRFEATDSALARAAVDVGLSPADQDAVTAALDLARDGILTATTIDEFPTAWADAVPAIYGIFVNHTGFATDAVCDDIQQYNTTRVDAGNVQTNLTAGSTHSEILLALFSTDSGVGLRGKTFSAMTGCPSLDDGNDRSAMARVFTHLALQQARVPE